MEIHGNPKFSIYKFLEAYKDYSTLCLNFQNSCFAHTKHLVEKTNDCFEKSLKSLERQRRTTAGFGIGSFGSRAGHAFMTDGLKKSTLGWAYKDLIPGAQQFFAAGDQMEFKTHEHEREMHQHHKLANAQENKRKINEEQDRLAQHMHTLVSIAREHFRRLQF